MAQDVPGGISSHTSSKTNKGGGRSSKNSKNVADEKTQNLLGPGWQKIAIDERGHYTYISPDGQTFSNLSAAQEHATRAGNNQGDAKRNKRKKQDRNSADGACSRDDTLVEPPLDAAPTRDKTARPFHKSYLREVEAVWHHTKFTKVGAPDRSWHAFCCTRRSVHPIGPCPDRPIVQHACCTIGLSGPIVQVGAPDRSWHAFCRTIPIRANDR